MPLSSRILDKRIAGNSLVLEPDSLQEPERELSLYENENRPSKEVKKITLEKISEIDKKLNDLKALRKELSYLANNCHGDDKPNCPILEALSKK